MEEFTRGFSRMIYETGRGLNSITMATHTKGILRQVRRKEKEFTLGQTESSTMESGRVDSSMGTACGRVFMVTLTLGNGNNRRRTGMESMSGKTGIDTRVNGTIALSMGSGQTFSATETSILDTTSMGNLMDRVNTPGRTVVFMWGILRKDLNMVREDGDEAKKIPQISTKASTSMIRKTGMASSLGLVVTFIKATTKTMNEKDTERCTGLMVLST